MAHLMSNVNVTADGSSLLGHSVDTDFLEPLQQILEIYEELGQGEFSESEADDMKDLFLKALGVQHGHRTVVDSLNEFKQQQTTQASDGAGANAAHVYEQICQRHGQGASVAQLKSDPNYLSFADRIDRLLQGPTTHGSADADGGSEEEDDDDGVGASPGGGQLEDADGSVTAEMNQFKDPISQKVIVDPVRNTRCGHVYDRNTISVHIKATGGKAKCPYVGCTNKTPLNLRHFEPDAKVAKMLADRLRR